LASIGRQVVALETDEHKLSALQAGCPPFYEPGLEELLGAALAGGRLRFTDNVADAMDSSDVVFLCVGTPPGGDGHPVMSAFIAAARAIGAHLRHYHVLVTKSTVPIGSGNWLTTIVEEALPDGEDSATAFSVASCPEFLGEGSAIRDFLHPDRVVLGSDHQHAINLVAEVYRPILDQSFPGGDPQRIPALVSTSLETAEMAKYASNAFLATKISFINEIANLCELVGADVDDVATAMGLDPRISPRFLDAGVGWGGSCFGKDLSALVSMAVDYGYRPQLLEAVVAVNERQRHLMLGKLRAHLKTLRGKRVALLGLAFKGGTDDLRDAPAVDVAAWLLSAGASVRGHDPMVRSVPGLPGLALAGSPYTAAAEADALILLTDWPEYQTLDLVALRNAMHGDLLIDGRNLLDPAAAGAAGFTYEGVGRLVPRNGQPAGHLRVARQHLRGDAATLEASVTRVVDLGPAGQIGAAISDGRWLPLAGQAGLLMAGGSTKVAAPKPGVEK
jgi:nucleotide sugar dehydrogenase